jgi:flagella basal body P-ring formation protein FlgA
MVDMKTNRKVQGRVRTQWLALGGALVVLAGVLVAWGLSKAADRVSVVQLARPVPSGTAFVADDLTITGIAYDGQVGGLVPAESLDAMVGRVAAFDLESGALLQTGMWRDRPLLASGEQSVGVVLQAGRFPAGLGPGDSAMAAPLAPGSSGTPVPVRVVDSEVTAEGDLSFTLAVAAADAVAVAQLAATEQLVLVGATTGGGS